jgi:hypothetical protein
VFDAIPSITSNHGSRAAIDPAFTLRTCPPRFPGELAALGDR